MTILFAAGQVLTAAQLNALVPVTAVKLADETLNNVTGLQNDDELLWAVSASSTYLLHLSISYNSGTTPDIKFGWSVPASTTMKWRVIGADTAGAVILTSGLTESSVQPIGGAGADTHLLVEAVITVSTTAGNVTLQWAQNTANVSNTIVRAGSAGYLVKT